MSELIPDALGRRQPAAFLSGPSFAKEVMDLRPTGVVAASKVWHRPLDDPLVDGPCLDFVHGTIAKEVLVCDMQDKKLAREMQGLFASPFLRVNTTTDVTGVEICGALKNVLALAAGIVEGLELGNNAMAALVAQGCAEIRWLAEKMGAKSATVSGLSGLGDIMLTCYGSLSRNRCEPGFCRAIQVQLPNLQSSIRIDSDLAYDAMMLFQGGFGLQRCAWLGAGQWECGWEEVRLCRTFLPAAARLRKALPQLEWSSVWLAHTESPFLC